MATPTDPLWPALVASIAAVAVGGVSVHFKLFIESDSDFRKRIELHRAKITEQVAGKLSAVLQHVRIVVNSPDTNLRGDGYEDPDLIGEMAQVIRKFSTTVYRLEIIRTLVRAAYFILYISICFGFLSILFCWTWEAARAYLLWFAIALIVLQAIVVYGVIRASNALEVYEDVL